MPTLEEEIKQPQFKSEKAKALIHLMVTNGWILEQHKEFFKPYNISKQQYNVMRILRGQHPNGVSVNDIKNRLLDKMSDASRLVDRLVSKGLVERKVNASDRRSAKVILSESGMALLSRIDEKVHQIEGLLDVITEEEAQVLNQAFEKIRNQKS